MRWHWCLLILGIVMMSSTVFVIVDDAQVEDAERACEARGGRLVHITDGRVCLDRSVFR